MAENFDCNIYVVTGQTWHGLQWYMRNWLVSMHQSLCKVSGKDGGFA